MWVNDQQVIFNVFNVIKSPDEVEDCNFISVVDFVVVKRLCSCCSKEEINAVTFEELENEGREIKKLTWLGDKQLVRNDKHFESLDHSNKSREEFGGCIEEIQEGYWLRDPT